MGKGKVTAIFAYQLFCLAASVLGLYTSFRRLNLVNRSTDNIIRYSVLLSISACVYFFLMCIQMKLVDPGLLVICLSISLWELADKRRSSFKNGANNANNN